MQRESSPTQELGVTCKLEQVHPGQHLCVCGRGVCVHAVNMLGSQLGTGQCPVPPPTSWGQHCIMNKLMTCLTHGTPCSILCPNRGKSVVCVFMCGVVLAPNSACSCEPCILGFSVSAKLSVKSLQPHPLRKSGPALASEPECRGECPSFLALSRLWRLGCLDSPLTPLANFLPIYR